jgi:hypothetical protein
MNSIAGKTVAFLLAAVGIVGAAWSFLTENTSGLESLAGPTLLAALPLMQLAHAGGQHVFPNDGFTTNPGERSRPKPPEQPVAPETEPPPDWTLPQLRYLIAITLEVGQLSCQEALEIVKWTQRRNAVARKCHRASRIKRSQATRPALK